MRTIIYTVFILCFFLVNLGKSQAQNGLHFDGVDDYVQTTYAGISGTSPRTIEAYIKTTANCNPSNGGVQQVIADYGTFVTGARFTFNVLWADAIRLEVGGNGLSGTIPVNDGQWHHVAVTYDPSAANQIKLYVDGVLDAEGNLTVSINTTLGTDLVIGRRVDNINNFEGSIDEVRFWDIALSQAQIQAKMSEELCLIPSDLVAYYTFNEGSAAGNNVGETTLEDLSANANNGTLNNFLLNGSTSNWVQGATLGGGLSTTNQSASACDTYTWAADGNTYTNSGIYEVTLPGSSGCDSTIILDLTINTGTSSSMTVSECTDYTWPVDGNVYNATGTYTASFTNAAGCDSTITLDLTITGGSMGSADITACDEYTWVEAGMVYNQSGTFTATLTDANGCDSVATLNLTIPVINLEVSENWGDCSLTAAQSGASYNWLYCNFDYSVTGDTGQYNGPWTIGLLAVEITLNGCVDTSDCYGGTWLSVVDQTLSQQVSIFPNPTTESFVLDLGEVFQDVSIEVFNSVGQLVLAQNVENVQNLPLEIKGADGFYWLKITIDGDRIATKKILKSN